jgi:hypothetical protein
MAEYCLANQTDDEKGAEGKGEAVAGYKSKQRSHSRFRLCDGCVVIIFGEG